MGPRSPEAKLANKIIEGLNVVQINTGFIAYMLYQKSGGVIQKRIFDIFMHLVKHWCVMIENGEFDTDNYDVGINAMRIKDAMEKHGYTFE